MKSAIILFTAGAFVFFSLGFAQAEDFSELKEQIKVLQETINAQQKTIDALNTKIQGVEQKQEAQAKEIKKVPELAKKVGELKETTKLPGLLEGISIGGHVKLYMFDRTQGERNDVHQHTNLSSGVGSHAFILYVTKQLTDWLKVDTETDFGISAGATPAIGSNITRATTGSTSFSLNTVAMTANLPQDAELKVGVFWAMFSEEYTKQTWWHEVYHQNKGLTELQSWHDSGIELYKNFDFDKWSLPVYFSLLNGNPTSRYVENNDDKTVLLHIAPELFQTKLRLLGTIGGGKWDDGDNGKALYAVSGFDWKYQKFNLTSEYIYKKYRTVPLAIGGANKANADGKNEGYYIRAMYTFNPKWRALLKYSHAELYKTGIPTMRSDNYDTTSLALNYFITPNSTIIGQYMFIDGARSDESERIEANRFTLGWRTTF